MDVAQAGDWLTFFNLIGAPLAVLIAIHQGWLVTRREVTLLQTAYDDLTDRYERLEAAMHEEQVRMRGELELTRTQLIQLLVKGEVGD